MVDLSSLTSPAPYHLLSYGTLLGTQFFQSFVGGIVAYKALPRPQFASLQQAIFPIYLSLQTALPVLIALTYPGEHKLTGSTNSGLGGVLAEGNRTHVLMPLLMVFASSLANLALVGPATTRIMRERKHQETRDGKKSYDSPPHSKEMTRMNSAFARMHGASSLLNLIGLLATIWYGFTLGERIR